MHDFVEVSVTVGDDHTCTPELSKSYLWGTSQLFGLNDEIVFRQGSFDWLINSVSRLQNVCKHLKAEQSFHVAGRKEMTTFRSWQKLDFRLAILLVKAEHFKWLV